MSDLPPPLRDTNWHARLRRLGEALGARVAAAWSVYARRLDRNVPLIEDALMRALQTGGNASDILQRAAAQITAAGRQFSDELLALSQRGAEDGWLLGVEAAEGMTAAQLGRGEAVLLANFRSPTAEMARQLERIVDSEAFKASVARFGADIGSKAGDLLLYGLAQGYNPRRIATLLTNYLVSVPAVWAETTARTAQLYAYRRATHETYRANADIIDGWMWWSARDVRTCLSCLSLHGETFPLSEELNDHHRGRCSAIGIVRGSTWPNDVQRGPEWFAGLDAVRQREMMGPGMFAAYQAGGVDWSRMSVTYQNDVYGPMRRQATLRELGIARTR